MARLGAAWLRDSNGQDRAIVPLDAPLLDSRGHAPEPDPCVVFRRAPGARGRQQCPVGA